MSETERLNHEEFIRKAIVTLRKEGFKGIHSVFSGFNNAFKKYFEGENPVDVTNKLAQEGKIVIRPVKGGVMLYLPEDAPASRDSADEALKKMGL
jgi:predicted membrane protein